MRDIVVRKRALDQDFVCSTYIVPEGNYRFSLEGCNEYAEGIIRNAKGDVVAILKPGESVDIARRGKYLICIEGRNAVGTIFTEWVVPPATDSKEYCCDELRATDEVLRTQIEGVKDKIKNIQEVVVEAGVNVTVIREGNTYTVNAVDTIPDVDKAYVDAKIAAIEDKDTITTVSAGDNVTVTQTGNDYKVSAVDTKPDVDRAYVDQKIAAIVDKDTVTTVSAGDNVTVTQTGNDYKVSAVLPPRRIVKVEAGNNIDVATTVDSSGENITYKVHVAKDNDTITTVKAGANVSVTQNGNEYTVNAVDTIPDVDKAYVDAKIAAIEDKDTITTVSAGDNVTVTQTGNDYKVSAVLPPRRVVKVEAGNNIDVTTTVDSSGENITYKVHVAKDNDTITTVKAGANVSVTQNGNEYTINAVDTIPDVDKAYVDAKIAAIVDNDTITTVKAGANVTVTQSGNEYTVNAADTITTVKAGANVTISKSGNEYTVNTDVNKAYVDDKIANIQDENTITTVSAGKNIGVTKTGDDYEVKTLDDVEFNKVKLSVSTDSVSAENLIQPAGYSLKITTNGTARSTAITNIGSHNISLSLKEELGTGANTYLLHDDKIEILPTYIRFTVDGEEAPAGGSILGLGNKTFDPTNITSGRAATEDQLIALKNSIESNLSDNDTFHFTETSDEGIYRSKSFTDTRVFKNSMSLAQYDGTRNYGKSSIYLSEIDPTTRYYKFVEDYVIGSREIVVSLEDIGFPYTDITIENILKYPIRWGGSFYNPINAVIDNENKTITISIDRPRNSNNGWLAGDKIPLGTANYGNGSFVTGAQNYSSKSVVAGNDLTVNRGNFSFVVGNALYNAGNDAIVGGYLNKNTGQNSIVSGRSNINVAERSFLIGNENKNATAATDSVVFGVKNENTKTNSFVFGAQNKNEGASSFVGGGANTNTAINSFIYGTQCNNTGMMNVLFGLGHDSSQGGGYLFACGYHSEITGNTLFAVGNGQETAKKNAFEVSKDGSIYLRSPNGTKYKLAVDDSGTLTVTPAT